MPYFRLICVYPPLVENEELSLPVKPSVEIEGDQIVLGKKLDNPYTYDNMQSVYNEWCMEVGCTPVPLEFSHYYVRFLPRDSTEMRLLEGYDIAFF